MILWSSILSDCVAERVQLTCSEVSVVKELEAPRPADEVRYWELALGALVRTATLLKGSLQGSVVRDRSITEQSRILSDPSCDGRVSYYPWRASNHDSVKSVEGVAALVVVGLIIHCQINKSKQGTTNDRFVKCRVSSFLFFKLESRRVA